LHPSTYVPNSGDYYEEIAAESCGFLWADFPVKVFPDRAPEEWGLALNEALGAWMAVFPLRKVGEKEKADVVLRWAKLPNGTSGTERDLFHVNNDNGIASRRKESLITLDTSRRWSEHEMRAIVLHELGHALGIVGHSRNPKDVMFPQEVNTVTLGQGSAGGHLEPPGVSLASTGINTKLTPRDVNTLIRLYNCPGPVVYLK
jgi:predicted Zn-dependent protease